ncbi:hypothetical protein HELRODRAFT_88777 [Helobdella robusta]|uniref:Exoribonuclease phosphorolytic domain-containing protein n=1 Tax=Helobdella robusta TaxID=6412 RepID=T1G762_HELRO|nr:hypothetical protein HELRODRAFT_88777 [Helobdella robusta]ESN93464.1 hypothetical protein HELRODRAFT_88777 [Helobdella robusta]
MLEIRKSSCRLAFLSKSDGSVKLKHGQTSVVAAVNGPLDVKIIKEQVDKMNVDIIFKYKTESKAKNQRTMEKLIQQICECSVLVKNFPRTNLTIALQELEDDGSLLACCINATCLALLDACIPMKQLFAAVSVCFNKVDDTITIDPTLSQESQYPGVTFVFNNGKFNVIAMHSNSFLSKEVLNKSLLQAREHAKLMFDSYRDLIKQSHQIV